MSKEWLELRWGRTIDDKMVAVHGTLYTIPLRNSNQLLQKASENYTVEVFLISSLCRARRDVDHSPPSSAEVENE
jgi:hypothetical protein